jgi:hypothetical protein
MRRFNVHQMEDFRTLSYDTDVVEWFDRCIRPNMQTSSRTHLQSTINRLARVFGVVGPQQTTRVRCVITNVRCPFTGPVTDVVADAVTGPVVDAVPTTTTNPLTPAPITTMYTFMSRVATRRRFAAVLSPKQSQWLITCPNMERVLSVSGAGQRTTVRKCALLVWIVESLNVDTFPRFTEALETGRAYAWFSERFAGRRLNGNAQIVQCLLNTTVSICELPGISLIRQEAIQNRTNATTHTLRPGRLSREAVSHRDALSQEFHDHLMRGTALSVNTVEGVVAGFRVFFGRAFELGRKPDDEEDDDDIPRRHRRRTPRHSNNNTVGGGGRHHPRCHPTRSGIKRRRRVSPPVTHRRIDTPIHPVFDPRSLSRSAIYATVVRYGAHLQVYRRKCPLRGTSGRLKPNQLKTSICSFVRHVTKAILFGFIGGDHHRRSASVATNLMCMDTIKRRILERVRIASRTCPVQQRYRAWSTLCPSGVSP